MGPKAFREAVGSCWIIQNSDHWRGSTRVHKIRYENQVTKNETGDIERIRLKVDR